jgi:hypothetical protein
MAVTVLSSFKPESSLSILSVVGAFDGEGVADGEGLFSNINEVGNGGRISEVCNCRENDKEEGNDGVINGVLFMKNVLSSWDLTNVTRVETAPLVVVGETVRDTHSMY